MRYFYAGAFAAVLIIGACGARTTSINSLTGAPRDGALFRILLEQLVQDPELEGGRVYATPDAFVATMEELGVHSADSLIAPNPAERRAVIHDLGIEERHLPEQTGCPGVMVLDQNIDRSGCPDIPFTHIRASAFVYSSSCPEGNVEGACWLAKAVMTHMAPEGKVSKVSVYRITGGVRPRVMRVQGVIIE